MTEEKDTEHIRIDTTDKSMFCTICDGRYMLKLPMKLSDVLKKIKAFETLHIDCAEKEKGITK